MSNTEREALTVDIVGCVTEATEIMSQIARLMAAGNFSAAAVRTDYLMGQIKSAERTQKYIAKMDAKAAKS